MQRILILLFRLLSLVVVLAIFGFLQVGMAQNGSVPQDTTPPQGTTQNRWHLARSLQAQAQKKQDRSLKPIPPHLSSVRGMKWRSPCMARLIFPGTLA